ncbi:hypothetical protein LCGC14_1934020 [marine sediment metagenome]|uniref:HMA domain-containing protein n=1 Tax=marine sediment metagenome TaxID=412755 RepID=A0A0F9FMN0_9ZZZZ
MKKQTYKIQGMHCAGCVRTLERVLMKTAGVRSASVNFASESALIEFDEQVISDSDLAQTIESVGYKLEIATQEKKEEEKTLEEQLEEQLSDQEIENFKIEKVDMEKLTHRVCDILAVRESSGMIQSELWKKLKLSSRDGSRLALKLERMGNITREKILENGRWTYKLILKKTPISTTSIENAPCLICPVEQKCTLEGEISPRTCVWIEEWVTMNTSKLKRKP